MEFPAPSMGGMADSLGVILCAGQYLKQASEPGDVQVLTKACVWGQNLYNAGKGRTMEQVRKGFGVDPWYLGPSPRAASAAATTSLTLSVLLLSPP